MRLMFLGLHASMKVQSINHSGCPFFAATAGF
jgi:hypothetical protein